MIPHDPAAEASVLGSLLLDNEAFEVVEKVLSAADFYSEPNRKVYTAARELFFDDEPVDLVTLTDKLRVKGHLEEVGNVAYLIGLIDSTPTSAYVESHARIVKGKATLREVIAVADRIKQGATDLEDPEELIGKAMDGLVGLSDREAQQTDEEDRILDMALKFADGSAFVPTGFNDLDTKIAGLPRGDLTYLCARNSHYKSTLLYQAGNNMVNFFRREQTAAGEEPNAWMFSMSPDQHPAQIWAMEASRLSGVPLSVIQGRDTQGKLTATETQINRWQDAVRMVRSDYTKRVRIRRGSIDPERVKSETLAALRGGAKIIALDTVQRAAGGGDRKVGDIGNVSAFLKDVAADYNAVVIALAQVRREVDDRDMEKFPGRRPHPNDIADAPTVIGNDAATMLFLYNDSRYNPYPGQDSIPVEINVAKNKSGEAGGWQDNTVMLTVQRAFAHFTNPSNPKRIQRWLG